MMFGTGSNAELTRNYERVKVQNDIRTSKHINKQTFPVFNCDTPESVSLAPLTNNIYFFIFCLQATGYFQALLMTITNSGIAWHH